MALRFNFLNLPLMFITHVCTIVKRFKSTVRDSFVLFLNPITTLFPFPSFTFVVPISFFFSSSEFFLIADKLAIVAQVAQATRVNSDGAVRERFLETCHFCSLSRSRSALGFYPWGKVALMRERPRVHARQSYCACTVYRLWRGVERRPYCTVKLKERK